MSQDLITASGGGKFTKKPNHDDFLKGKLLDVIQNSKKSYHEILMYIQNEINESTRIVAFNYKVKCFLEDGAYALNRAVEKINGFTKQKGETNISGEKPPEMLDVRFADGTREKVPFGTIRLPSFGEDAFIEMKYDSGKQLLLLQGQCEKRYVQLMDQIVETTQSLLAMDSIYKGRAIKIVSESKSPEFIDLSTVEKTPLFLTPEAAFSTQPIEARIEHTERCIRNNIDLRFGVLLEGEE